VEGRAGYCVRAEEVICKGRGFINARGCLHSGEEQIFWFSASIWKLSKKERALIKYAGQDAIEGDLWDVAHLSAKQSRLNAIASVFAGLADLLSGVSALIGTRWG
jgi:hypothetical protein